VGLPLVTDLNLKKLLVSSDCLEVINSINDLTNSNCFSILHEIDMRRLALENLSFSHKSRRLNIRAHNLARFFVYLNMGDVLWLLELPDTQIVPLMTE
jgi:hypothetical protein